LAVGFALVLPLTTVAAWGVTTVTNTDRWVSALHPLSSDPTITTYVAQQGAATVIRELHVQERIKKLLPSDTAFLSGTLTTQLENGLASALASALRTRTFQTLWDKENRLTHQVAVAVLQGRTNSTLAAARSVVLDMSPTIIRAIDRFDRSGNHFFDPLKRALKHDHKFLLRILSPKEVQRAQYYFRLVTTLDWLLPLVSLVMAVSVVMTSRPRRTGVRRLAISVVVSSAFAYCLLRIGIDLAAPLAPTPPLVAHAILSAVTSFLATELIWLMFAGLLGLALYWFSGETPGAKSARTYTSALFASATRTVMTESRQLARTDWHRWSSEHRARVRRALHLIDFAGMIVGLSLLLWWVNSLRSLAIFLVLALVWIWLSRRLHQRIRESSVATSSADEPGATTTQ
jgi:hypothetical protein